MCINDGAKIMAKYYRVWQTIPDDSAIIQDINS